MERRSGVGFLCNLEIRICGKFEYPSQGEKEKEGRSHL